MSRIYSFTVCRLSNIEFTLWQIRLKLTSQTMFQVAFIARANLSTLYRVSKFIDYTIKKPSTRNRTHHNARSI